MHEKRSFRIHEKSTTISLELPFWRSLEEIAMSRDINLSTLITRLNDDFQGSGESNFSSFIRVFCLSRVSGLTDAEGKLLSPTEGE